MRICILLPLLLALAFAPWLGGCGSADGIGGGARPGPHVVTLPFLPTSAAEAFVLGLKNLASDAAPVYVTAYDAAGGLYGAPEQMFTVPGHGEMRIPLGVITGMATAGGSLRVETRDVTNRDAATGVPMTLPTSGLVLPYVHRSVGGGSPDADAMPSLGLRAGGAGITLTPYTTGVQIINYSWTENFPMPLPLGATFRARELRYDGSELGFTDFALGGNASVVFTPGPDAARVSVEPLGGPFPANQHIAYAVAAQENGLQTHAESRFFEADTGHWPDRVDLGFAAAFGLDGAGNIHDFGLLLSNPTASSETVVLQGIYRKGGLPILTSPRAYNLGAGRTVIMKSTTQESRGLQQGEVSWFEDLFGDVFQTEAYDEFTLLVQASRDLDISARHYDPSFNAFYHVLRAVQRSQRACVYDFPLATSTSAGRRNWVSITNTTNGTLEVPIRAFTPQMGTEYILPPVLVPPLARLDWSPDGMVVREEPTDTLGPVVPFLRLEFAPITGALFQSRTESRDANELLLFITPTITRD